MKFSLYKFFHSPLQALAAIVRNVYAPNVHARTAYLLGQRASIMACVFVVLALPASHLAFAQSSASLLSALRPRPVLPCGFGTFTNTDVQRIQEQHSQEQYKNLTSLIKSPVAGIASERPYLHTFALSPQGRFAVWFDTLGTNAPPSTDRNNNHIPDYIDSALAAFDETYKVEVEQIGYDAPPLTDTVITAPDGRKQAVYTVYVLNLGADGIYGATLPVQRVGTGGARGRFTSYIVIDNDYSPFDSVLVGERKQPSYFTHHTDALRITAAHEFHHVIQLGSYGDSFNAEVGGSGQQQQQKQCALHELSSTWMERRVVPQVRDDRQFHPLLFSDAVLGKRPFSDGECLTGYVYTLFAEFLFARWGDAVLRRMWEYARAGAAQGLLYAALDSAVQTTSQGHSTLDDAWADFARWLYFTGTRSGLGTPEEHSQDAALLPEVSFARSEEMTPPSANVGGTVRPLEAQFIRFFAPNDSSSLARANGVDTVDVCIVAQNIAWNMARNMARNTTQSTFRYQQRFPFSLTAQPAQQGASRLEGTQTLITIDTDALQMQAYVNGRSARLLPSGLQICPHPIVAAADFPVTIALPEKFHEQSPATLTLYSLQGSVIARMQLAPVRVRTLLGLQWDGLTAEQIQIPSGFYGVLVEQDGTRMAGALLVQR